MSSQIPLGGKPEKILVTRGADYIGSVLAGQAMAQGYEAHKTDRFLFGDQSLAKVEAKFHHNDSRIFPPEILEDTDAVFYFASISNDPAGKFNQRLTIDVKYRTCRGL